MSKTVLTIALLAAVVLGLALAWRSLQPAGEGERVTVEPIDVGSFRELVVSGHAEVALVQGDAEAVTVESNSRAQARIRVRSANGVLRITAEENAPWWASLAGGGSRPPRVTVRFRNLDKLTLSGAVRLRAESVTATSMEVRASGATSLRVGHLQADRFLLTASGAVRSELAGRARELTIAISGAGDLRAADLVAEQAEVRVSGAGQVAVHATRSLDASISGAGTIAYAGEPKLRERISGAGRIKRLSEAQRLPRVRQLVA